LDCDIAVNTGGRPSTCDDDDDDDNDDECLNATIENKTSLTTYFKKLTIGNSLFVISVIV